MVETNEAQERAAETREGVSVGEAPTGIEVLVSEARPHSEAFPAPFSSFAHWLSGVYCHPLSLFLIFTGGWLLYNIVLVYAVGKLYSPPFLDFLSI